MKGHSKDTISQIADFRAKEVCKVMNEDVCEHFIDNSIPLKYNVIFDGCLWVKNIRDTIKEVTGFTTVIWHPCTIFCHQ